MKLSKQGYRYHKIRKALSKSYHRHSEVIVKYNIGVNTLLEQCISEPIFYGDLVSKIKIIIGKPIFVINSKRLSNVIKSWIELGYKGTVCLHSCKPNHGL